MSGAADRLESLTHGIVVLSAAKGFTEPLTAVPSYDDIVAFLASRSARQIAHVQSSFFEHLHGTYTLLKAWGNPPPVCYAGLTHAVYGTDGYAERLLDAATDRMQLAGIVGAEAEALVYLYASCDRGHLYPLIRSGQPLSFRDRFEDRVFVPDEGAFAAFMELTFANELEIFRHDPALVEQHREPFGSLFSQSRRFVSDGAYAYFTALFDGRARTAAR